MNLTLARAITCSPDGCRVQLLDNDDVTDAPLSSRMIEICTRIRPGMIVALDRSTTPPTIRWRFEVRAVEALAGDQLTILRQQFRFIDSRPEGERATPIRVGDSVVFRLRHASNEVEVIDTVEDGRPHHPEFLESQFPQIEAVYRDLANS